MIFEVMALVKEITNAVGVWYYLDEAFSVICGPDDKINRVDGDTIEVLNQKQDNKLQLIVGWWLRMHRRV